MSNDVLLYTIRIHIQKQANTNAGGLCCFRFERFINFLTSVLWHKARDTIFIMLTPSQRAAHLVVFKIFVGRDPKILTAAAAATVEKSTLCHNGRNSIVCLHGPMSTFNWRFFKILNVSGPSLSDMTSSILQPHFLSGGLLWQMVIIISFALEREAIPNDYTPELRAK